MKILVTGLNGFVGKALLNKVKNFEVVCFGRSKPNIEGVEHVEGDLNDNFSLQPILKGVDVVVHLAARVHIVGDTDHELYFRTNTIATERLVEQSIESGVKRFIFLSTIKVNGERTLKGQSFKVDDDLAPVGPYAESKFEAECIIKKLCAGQSMDYTIIRPPLVYGPEVKGNFINLMRLVGANIPLPFKNINNERSLVSVDNLVDLIDLCVRSAKASNQTFLVSDGVSVSTSKLVSVLARVLGKRVFLFSVPHLVWWLLGKFFTRSGFVARLNDNLSVDIQHTMNTLSWSPNSDFEDQIRKYFEVK